MKRVHLRYWITALILLNFLLLFSRVLSFPAMNRSFTQRTRDTLGFHREYNYGLLALGLNRKSAALEHFRNAHQAQPSSHSCRMHLTRLLQWLGSDYLNKFKPDLAREYFDELTLIDPSNPAGILFKQSTISNTNLMLSNIPQQLTKKEWTLALDFARIWTQFGADSPTVTDWLNTACSDHPSILWLHLIAGDAFWMQQKPEEALVAYQHARTLGMASPILNLRLGYLQLIEFKNSQTACQILRPACKSLSENGSSDILITLGLNGCPEPEYAALESVKPMKPIAVNLRHEQEILLSHLMSFWSFLRQKAGGVS